MAKGGFIDEAVDLLDRGMQATRRFPLETIPIGFVANDYMLIDIISQYYKYGEADKANAIAEKMAEEMIAAAVFYFDFYEYAQNDFETIVQYAYYLEDEVRKGGNTELADKIASNLKAILGQAVPFES